MNVQTCFLCLDQIEGSEKKSFIPLPESRESSVEIKTFGRLFALSSDLQIRNGHICPRCSHSLLMAHHGLEELVSLEKRINEIKDEIQKRMLYLNPDNLTTPLGESVKNLRKNIIKDITSPKASNSHFKFSLKTSQNKPNPHKNDKKLSQKVQVCVKRLNLPIAPNKSYFLLDPNLLPKNKPSKNVQNPKFKAQSTSEKSGGKIYIKKEINPKKYSCTICGRYFSQLKYLESHRNIHNQFLCSYPECGKVFRTKTLRHQHWICGHNFRCEECKIFFDKNFQLVQHSREIHQKEPFICYICQHPCISQKWLSQHITRVHLEVKNKRKKRKKVKKIIKNAKKDFRRITRKGRPKNIHSVQKKCNAEEINSETTSLLVSQTQIKQEPQESQDPDANTSEIHVTNTFSLFESPKDSNPKETPKEPPPEIATKRKIFTYKCNICDNKFYSLHSINQHIKSHVFPCPSLPQNVNQLQTGSASQLILTPPNSQGSLIISSTNASQATAIPMPSPPQILGLPIPPTLESPNISDQTEPQKIINCQICNLNYLDFQFPGHLQTHCPEYPATTSTMTLDNIQLQNSIACQVCRESFTETDLLYNHMQDKHINGQFHKRQLA